MPTSRISYSAFSRREDDCAGHEKESMMNARGVYRGRASSSSSSKQNKTTRQQQKKSSADEKVYMKWEVCRVSDLVQSI